ncbi:MAG: glucose-1-phosphate thymidylyltransferase [Saprospiraceae bacterium]|nr:glucose-1-phosphate thymidylyltransferase [Saprospiraceae bacterium]
MNCILLDQQNSSRLWPLSRTRPVAGLRIGILTIEEKWSVILSCKTSNLCNSQLQQVFKLNIESDNLVISGSILPNESTTEKILQLESGECILDKQDQFVAGRLNDSDCNSLYNSYSQQTLTESLKKFKCSTIDSVQRLEYPWQIFQWNGDEIIKDYKLITQGRTSQKIDSTNSIIGENIFVEEGAVIQCSILNSSTGPIYIGKSAEVMEGSIIRGPFALCDHASTKLGTKIYGPTTIGPNCKVGGEVNNSVFQSNSNKAHDGFIGNSVIGEWCNIGADSNNSNLKNTYTEVKLWNYETNSFLRTGSIFCGLVMGDHAKCGINTMFNTGTVVGVGANIFGSGFPRQFIPDFAWGGASGFKTFTFKEFLETAKAVMNRRKKELSSEEVLLLENIFIKTKEYRTWED